MERPHVESDSVWMGYRVRRTIKGITDAVRAGGEHKAKEPGHEPVHLHRRPCDLSQFVFYGTGIFFKDSDNFANGKYIIDIRPAPHHNCARAEFSPTRQTWPVHLTICCHVDRYVRIVNSDFTESAIDSSEIVTVQPATPPRTTSSGRGGAEPLPRLGRMGPGSRRQSVHSSTFRGSTVRIYTSNGELVRVLVQNPNANMGGTTGELEWDLKNADGRKVVSASTFIR